MFCNCEKGCDYCDKGRIYFYECPYSLIDGDAQLFYKLYNLHKSKVFTYGSYIDYPNTLLDYFDVLESELKRWDEAKKESVNDANEMLRKLTS